MSRNTSRVKTSVNINWLLTNKLVNQKPVVCLSAYHIHWFTCRSVGVSNFGVQHLEGLRKAGRPTPSVNQIELHTMKKQQHIVDYCREHGITVMGYSPLAKADKMNDEKLTGIATR